MSELDEEYQRAREAHQDASRRLHVAWPHRESDPAAFKAALAEYNRLTMVLNDVLARAA